MITNLVVTCPFCQSSSELFLTTHSNVIVLNCPHCWTPLVHTTSGVFVLTENQLAELATDSQGRALNRLLNKMTGDSSMNKKDSTEHKFSPPVSISSSLYEEDERTCISHDDIVNLQIDLATIKDSLELIEKI